MISNYEKIKDLIIQCEYELRGNKTSKEFAPSCSIDILALYLHMHGVKVESEVVDNDT